MGDQSLCYPLTITDHFSRYLLGCESLSSTKAHGVVEAFEEVFDQYGIPDVIRSDNGSPFGSTGLLGLTKLSVWWIKLGIRPERIEPGCPEQNGRHERFHRTLKQDVLRPPRHNLLQQQESFDQFLMTYNLERPHEALGQVVPSALYKKSTKVYKGPLELQYPQHDFTRKVSKGGDLRSIAGSNFFISQALAGEVVGIRELDSNLWLVSFADQDLGYIRKGSTKLMLELPDKD